MIPIKVVLFFAPATFGVYLIHVHPLVFQFVIKDESKESPADKFRVVAKKDTYDGKMELNDTVSGPKFSKYWSDVYDIMEEDTFFTERSYY